VRRPRWPELRAGLIGIAIVLGLVEGCPIPEPSETLAWQRGYTEAIRPVQRAVLVPFGWIARDLRFGQRWALFQVGPRERFRFVVEGRRGGAWELLYRAGDPDHRAWADQLEYRRVAGARNPTDRAMQQYTGLAAWLTARVLAERPDLDAVRVRHARIVIDHGEVTDTGEHAMAYTRLRSAR
jgi:hypothetical protein